MWCKVWKFKHIQADWSHTLCYNKTAISSKDRSDFTWNPKVPGRRCPKMSRAAAYRSTCTSNTLTCFSQLFRSRELFVLCIIGTRNAMVFATPTSLALCQRPKRCWHNWGAQQAPECVSLAFFGPTVTWNGSSAKRNKSGKVKTN